MLDFPDGVQRDPTETGAARYGNDSRHKPRTAAAGGGGIAILIGAVRSGTHLNLRAPSAGYVLPMEFGPPKAFGAPLHGNFRNLIWATRALDLALILLTGRNERLIITPIGLTKIWAREYGRGRGSIRYVLSRSNDLPDRRRNCERYCRRSREQRSNCPVPRPDLNSSFTGTNRKPFLV